MTTDLKPCPFCGSATTLDDERLLWVASCTGCGACVLGDRAPEPEQEMPAAYWEPFRQSAVDRWNRRAALAQPEPVVLTRPDCFNFAMDFLGGTEESEVRNYIERLESAASVAQPEPVAEGVSYRQLLAALESLIHKFDVEDCTTICELEPWKDLVSAAKDAQPEPVAPTDEEILASVRHFYGDQTAADMGAEDDLRTARAVLARWGTPANVLPTPEAP
jgi:hypothetical protein